MDFEDPIETQKELLRVYRTLVRISEDREFLRGQLSQARYGKKSFEAKFEEERCRRIETQDAWDRDSNEQEERISNLLTEVVLLRDAHDQVLDLVGAVIDQELANDQLSQMLQCAFSTNLDPEVAVQFPGSEVVVENLSVMAESMDTDQIGPARCLSCNGDKGDGLYLCEECFELSIDHESVLFEELQDAWDAGFRDFPRPGKNAKVLYAQG